MNENGQVKLIFFSYMGGARLPCFNKGGVCLRKSALQNIIEGGRGFEVHKNL